MILIIILIFIGLTYFLTYQVTRSHPLSFSKEINHYAGKYGLDPQLVAGIIKTESDFQEDVIANDGGRGLMQLMPDTAKWCAGQMGVQYDLESLLKADYNLDMGCFYLSYLVQKYQMEDMAQAAYNAGPRAVDDWLADGVIQRDAESLKNIPYDITRNYVVHVNRAKKVYSIFYPETLPETESGGKLAGRAFSNMGKLFSWAFGYPFS